MQKQRDKQKERQQEDLTEFGASLQDLSILELQELGDEYFDKFNAAKTVQEKREYKLRYNMIADMTHANAKTSYQKLKHIR